MFKPFFVNLFADFQNKIAKLFVFAFFFFLLYYVLFISKTRASSENVNHEVKATL